MELNGLSITFRSNFPELTQTLEKVDKLPKKLVTKAARKGALTVIRQTRAEAPRKTGTLKKALYLKREKTRRSKIKAVYEVTFKPGTELSKTSKSGKRSYYPASQEYGFYTVAGHKHTSHGYADGKRTYTMDPVESGTKHPGLHYLRRSAEITGPAAITAMMETLNVELEKEWAKQQEVLHDGF